MFCSNKKNYGKDSPKPRPISIPNFELFNNFTINGPLHVILSTLLVGATIRDLLPFDTLFENESSKLLPILFEIDKELEAVSILCFLFSKSFLIL